MYFTTTKNNLYVVPNSSKWMNEVHAYQSWSCVLLWQVDRRFNVQQVRLIFYCSWNSFLAKSCSRKGNKTSTPPVTAVWQTIFPVFCTESANLSFPNRRPLLVMFWRNLPVWNITWSTLFWNSLCSLSIQSFSINIAAFVWRLFHHSSHFLSLYYSQRTPQCQTSAPPPSNNF